MYAAEKGLTDIVNLLLRNGASVNVKNDNRMTALHLAVKNCKLDVVKLLLKNNADASIICNDGKTALDILVEVEDREGHEQCKIELIANLLTQSLFY